MKMGKWALVLAAWLRVCNHPYGGIWRVKGLRARASVSDNTRPKRTTKQSKTVNENAAMRFSVGLPNRLRREAHVPDHGDSSVHNLSNVIDSVFAPL